MTIDRAEKIIRIQEKEQINKQTSSKYSYYAIEILMQIQIKVNDNLAEICSVYEGQTAEEVADELAVRHCLSQETKEKIIKTIQLQLDDT